MNLEFKKYKRAFAFGCSFTLYPYPTWADLIFNEIEGECYNFGKQGSGNLAISAKIAEANNRFHFNETDLIMVMYSSSCREDRYIDGTWKTYGNVYSYDYYDESFVKKYVDPEGCIIRDLALIELSSHYIKSLPCDNIILYGFDLYGEDNLFKQLDNNKLLSVYPELFKIPSVESFLFPEGLVQRSVFIKYGEEHHDVHPTTVDYLNYLNHVGINLSEQTHAYAYECDKKIENKLNHDDVDALYATFPVEFDRHKNLLF